MKILVVEDEASIAIPLSNFLVKNGYQVFSAASLAQARKQLEEQTIGVVILDRALPDGDGLSLLRDLKARELKINQKTPALILTAKVELSDRILGFDLGADDYITKPFEPEELLARLKARIRNLGRPNNENAPDNEMLATGDISLDLGKLRAFYRKNPVSLTLKEFQLLEFFVRNAGRAVSRETLLLKVWGIRFNSTRTLDVHISSLRQKFSAETFETVHGLGYRFRDPSGSDPYGSGIQKS